MFYWVYQFWRMSHLTLAPGATPLKSLLDQVKLRPDAAIAYFYFDFNIIEKQQTQSAIRSLLFQLAL